MKIVGKIGESSTKFDVSSVNGEIHYSYSNSFFILDNLKIKSIQGFGSIRANNCVFKRKWVFEVQIVSHNLQQIGWCQINTPFTSTDGVGDDLSSYAIDGYRLVLWHAGKKSYGKMWDVGDVIGCCIDLDSRKLEYFINGESQGYAAEDLQVGENVAYFPSISLSQEEKAIFNFGQSPFKFSYPGYEPFDLPQCIFNGSVEITAELIDLLKHSLIKTLSASNQVVSAFQKISLTNKIFNFLNQVSFKDVFIFKTLLLPFLYETASKRPKDLEIFFEHFFIYITCKKEKLQFVKFLFDNLVGMIEENSISGIKYIDEWRNLINLFLELIKIDYIAELWIETGETTENLKYIFNSNLFKIRDLYSYMKMKYLDFSLDTSAYKAFKEVKKEFYEKYLIQYEKYEVTYSENLRNVLLFFLTDKRTFKTKLNQSDSENATLKVVLIEYVNKGNDFFGLNNNNNLMEVLGQSVNKKDHTFFFKNFIFSLYMVLSEFMSKDLDTFGIDLWFKRLSSKNLFYDEVGIGGTINHVTNEYTSFVDEKYKENNGTFESEVNHRIIKITNVLLSQLKDLMRTLDKYKSVSLKQIVNFDNGTDHFSKLFRTYFYLFNDYNQILLYKYGFFLIKWINNMIRSNKYLVYFMPKSLFDIPFEIYRFLVKIKASVLKNDDLREKINSSSPHFKKDDFTYEIIYFYTYLFSDSSIANPDIKESLIIKMKYLIKKKENSIIYEQSNEIIEYLIKGVLNYMSIETLSHIACEIMVKLIKPMCFGHQSNLYEKGKLVEVTKQFFEHDIKTFHEFMDNYSKLINKVMTEYTISLNECTNKILNQSGLQIGDLMDTKTTLIKKLTFVYSLLCDLIKIFEFLLTAYPYEFFDITTLNYSRFTNFLKNTASRILEKNYIGQLMQLLEKTKATNNFPGKVQSLLLMAYSIIGIFINIDLNKEIPKYDEFIKKLANLPDLDMEPFLELYKTVLNLNEDPKLLDGIEQYKLVVEKIISSSVKKRERTMSVL
jgi:hypothetical protein